MVERRFYFGRVLVALLISSVIFILIFSFAQWISYSNYREISANNNFVQNSLDELEKAVQNSSCNESVLLTASEKLDYVGAGLGLLELRLGKTDPSVIGQKKLYSELELRHFNLIKKIRSDCNASFTTILFFYSNSDDALQRSDIAGRILTTFKRRAPSGIMIYSFDYNINSSAVDGLKADYQVDRAPFVLVNEKDLILNLENIDQLDKYSA